MKKKESECTEAGMKGVGGKGRNEEGCRGGGGKNESVVGFGKKEKNGTDLRINHTIFS